MAFGRYGAWRYGEADYGEGYGAADPDAPEGTVASAKDCTVFLCRESAGATDVSQYLTDLTASGGGGYESASTRANIPGLFGRGLCAVFEWDTSEAATVFIRHGSDGVATTQNYELRVTSSDVAQLNIDATTVVSLTLPDVSASSRVYMLTASTFANPDTTGSSDEVITVLSAMCATTGTWAHAQASHDASSGASGTLSIGGRWTGASLTEAATSLIAARIDNCYVSAVEYSEDFAYGARGSGAPTRTAVRREPARPGGDAFGADEYLGAGNVGWCGHATRANDMRLAGPIGGVLLQANSGGTASDYIEQTQVSSRYKTTLGGYTYPGGLVFPLVASQSVSRVRLRVHVSSYATSGAAQDVSLRALSCSRNPFTSYQSFGQGAGALRANTTQTTVRANHGSAATGTGGWYDLGELELASNPPGPNGPVEGLTGMSWLLIGYRLDGWDTSIQRLRIKAVHWWPVIASEDAQVGTGPDTTGIIAL